jgi:hypothetical protein
VMAVRRGTLRHMLEILGNDLVDHDLHGSVVSGLPSMQLHAIFIEMPVRGASMRSIG